MTKSTQNKLKLENEPLRLDSYYINTGEGFTSISSKCITDDVDVLKPIGRTSTENDAYERIEISHRIAKEKLRIGTWNIRTMSNGNLEIVKKEMYRTNVDLLGISEMKKPGIGRFTSEKFEIYYSGQDKLKRNGVAFICNYKMRRCILGFNPVNDRIATIRIKCRPINLSIIQVYAPTSSAEEEDIDAF